jgi:hypothetical protein
MQKTEQKCNCPGQAGDQTWLPPLSPQDFTRQQKDAECDAIRSRTLASVSTPRSRLALARLYSGLARAALRSQEPTGRAPLSQREALRQKESAAHEGRCGASETQTGNGVGAASPSVLTNAAKSVQFRCVWRPIPPAMASARLTKPCRFSKLRSTRPAVR